MGLLAARVSPVKPPNGDVEELEGGVFYGEEEDGSRQIGHFVGMLHAVRSPSLIEHGPVM